MGQAKDLTGLKVGRLTVLEKSDKITKSGESKWKCQCECGNVSYVRYSALKGGTIKSCGCAGVEKRLKNKAHIWQEMIGKRYGKLVVQKEIESKTRKKHLFLCKCDCGNDYIADGSRLKSNHVRSCGCLPHKVTTTTIETGYTKGYPDLYRKRSNMTDRCYNPHNKCYDIYGARGIKVCEEWRNSYDAFRNWALSHGYSKELTLDRIDCNGDYCPENCRFTDAKGQANNRRTNLSVIIGSAAYTTLEIQEKFGVPPYLIRSWLRRRMDLNRQIELYQSGKIRNHRANTETKLSV